MNLLKKFTVQSFGVVKTPPKKNPSLGKSITAEI